MSLIFQRHLMSPQGDGSDADEPLPQVNSGALESPAGPGNRGRLDHFSDDFFASNHVWLLESTKTFWFKHLSGWFGEEEIDHINQPWRTVRPFILAKGEVLMAVSKIGSADSCIRVGSKNADQKVSRQGQQLIFGSQWPNRVGLCQLWFGHTEYPDIVKRVSLFTSNTCDKWIQMTHSGGALEITIDMVNQVPGKVVFSSQNRFMYCSSG